MLGPRFIAKSMAKPGQPQLILSTELTKMRAGPRVPRNTRTWENTMLKTSLLFGAAFAALSMATVSAALADDAEIKAKAKSYTESEVGQWVADADVVAALNAANAANAAYDQAKIDELDKQWRAEVGAAAHPLIDSVMASPASAKAKSWCDGAGGVVTEVIVMVRRIFPPFPP